MAPFKCCIKRWNQEERDWYPISVEIYPVAPMVGDLLRLSEGENEYVVQNTTILPCNVSDIDLVLIVK